jgi:hypothetical protein
MKNSNDAVVHYLFFASQRPVANDIIGDIFAKGSCASLQAVSVMTLGIPVIHIVHDDDFVWDSRPDRLLRNTPYVDYLNFQA